MIKKSKLPGVKKYKSLKEALRSISQETEMLHQMYIENMAAVRAAQLTGR